MGTISRILGSRKALFTLIAFASTTALAWTGRVTGSEALEFMKWILGMWLAAQAAEDVTMHLKGTHPSAQPKAAETKEPAKKLLAEEKTEVSPKADSDPPTSS